jgi:acyl dehydratase
MTRPPEKADPAAPIAGEPIATLRLRLGPGDVRYGTRLVAGAKAVEIFGDLETEISIRTGGDEGLCVAYHSIEFLAPLQAGDFVEASAHVVATGRTSRRIDAVLYRVITADEEGLGTVLDPPVLAARATATIVGARRPDPTG